MLAPPPPFHTNDIHKLYVQVYASTPEFFSTQPVDSEERNCRGYRLFALRIVRLATAVVVVGETAFPRHSG